MKIFTLYLVCIMMLSEIVSAKEKYIQLEQNQYNLKNACYPSSKISDREKSFVRYYKFIFKSKYNVFENYDNAGPGSMVFKTNLYTINAYSSLPSLYIYRDSSFSSTKSVNNKKTIEAFLSEEDMKKLYERLANG